MNFRVQPLDEDAVKFALSWWAASHGASVYVADYKYDGRIHMSGLAEGESVDMLVHGLWPVEIGDVHIAAGLKSGGFTLVLHADGYDTNVQVNTTSPVSADHIQLGVSIEPSVDKMVETLARYGFKLAGKV